MRHCALALLAALALQSPAVAAADAPRSGYAQRTDVRAFITEMASRHSFSEAELRQLLS